MNDKKSEPVTVPVNADVTVGKKKRGGDPLDAIPYPEVRALAKIEQAMEGLAEPERRRVLSLVQDKYGGPGAVFLASARTGIES